MTSFTLTNVRPRGAAAVDIVVHGTEIAAVTPAGASAVEGDRVDGDGLLALPGFVNAHAHVDKTWWGQPWVRYGGEPTTKGRIAHERAERHKYGIPNLTSTTALLREFLRHGTTVVRSHVDVDLGVGLRGIDVVREAVAELDHAVDVQLVAFPQDGVLRRPGVLDLLDRAAEAGVTTIGGIDPASIDRDPAGQLDGLFEIAERHGVGLDIHLHDRGELGGFQFELIADRTRRTGLQGKVTISHGFALGELPASRQAELLDELRDAGISWATVASPGRTPLPWREMRDRGIPIALGTDGVRDLWSPYGDGDILRIALSFARLHDIRDDDGLGYAVELTGSHAAGHVHRTTQDLVAGARADLVLLDAETVQDALVRVPQRKLVMAGGRIVVRDGELQI